jgi:hypothetical protein
MRRVIKPTPESTPYKEVWHKRRFIEYSGESKGKPLFSIPGWISLTTFFAIMFWLFLDIALNN